MDFGLPDAIDESEIQNPKSKMEMTTAVENIPGLEVLDQSLESQMTLSMGPQHPSTHGVLRLDLRLDGELVVSHTTL